MTQVVGERTKGMLPHPAIQALAQGSIGHVASDLQVMMENERKQHQDAYQYEHGHNDHGMGQ
jgi:hypothetical protein